MSLDINLLGKRYPELNPTSILLDNTILAVYKTGQPELNRITFLDFQKNVELKNSKDFIGSTFIDGNFPRWSNALGKFVLNGVTISDIPDLDASKIISGTLNEARIPNLPISKITNLQEELNGKEPSFLKGSIVSSTLSLSNNIGRLFGPENLGIEIDINQFAEAFVPITRKINFYSANAQLKINGMSEAQFPLSSDAHIGLEVWADYSNKVMVVTIDQNDLSGVGELEEQVSEYINSNISVEYSKLISKLNIVVGTISTPIEVEYGILYNRFAAIDNREITNVGWRVPTNNDFSVLTSYVSENSGVLKEPGFIHWQTPNAGATNSTNFNLKGSGIRALETGEFTNQNRLSVLWASDIIISFGSPIAGRTVDYNTINIYPLNVSEVNSYKTGQSLRLIKESTTLSHGETGTYIGNDGKLYRTICIGTQEWLADNLCETQYRNGDPIPEVTDNATWAALSTGARCFYNNLESNAYPEQDGGGAIGITKIFEFVNKSDGDYGLGGAPILPEDLLLIEEELTSQRIEEVLGYVPESVANKAVDFSTINDTLYPTTKAVDDLFKTLPQGAGLGLSIDEDGNVQLGIDSGDGLQTIDLSPSGRTGVRFATASPQLFELSGDRLILNQAFGQLSITEGETQLTNFEKTSHLRIGEYMELMNSDGHIQWGEDHFRLLHSQLGELRWTGDNFQIHVNDPGGLGAYFHHTVDPDYYENNHPYYFEQHNETVSVTNFLANDSSKFSFIFRHNPSDSNTFALFTDNINNKGLQYAEDYSTKGTLDPLWIPSWGAVTNIIDSILLGYQTRSEKGAANGYVPLDNSSKIPIGFFPDSIVGGLKYGGTYNGSEISASSSYSELNGDPLPVIGYEGVYFIATVNFTLSSVNYLIGDWILSNGDGTYERIPNADAVTTVFGRIGNVVAVESDYQSYYPRLSQVYSNPSWINELAWSKIIGKPTSLSGYGITDATPSNRTLTINGVSFDLSSNRSWSITLAGLGGQPVGNYVTTDTTQTITAAKTIEDVTFGRAQSSIKYNPSLTLTLPAQGTKAAFLNIGNDSFIRVSLSSRENGAFQPITLTITRRSVGTGSLIIINKENPYFYPHPNDISFSFDDATGNIFAEKVLYSSPRTILVSKVEILYGTGTVLTGALTSAGTGIDQTVTKIGEALSITKLNTVAHGSITAPLFVKSGGLSSQFLKADGSVDSGNYSLVGHVHSASQITSGEFAAARLSPVSRFYKIDPQVPENGISDVHLSIPSVSEAAIEKGYLGNKTMFQRPVLVEYSTDSGVTWSDAGYTDTQLKNLVLGRYSGPYIEFESNWTNVRFMWDAASPLWDKGYVILNYLYFYINAQSNAITKIKIEKRNFSTGLWSVHVEETKRFSGNPAHVSFPHIAIPFTPTGHSDRVRLELGLDGTVSSNKFRLHNINWYGAYPANSQSDLYSWDIDKRVTFGGDVQATGFRVGGNYVFHIGNHAHRTDAQNDDRYSLLSHTHLASSITDFATAVQSNSAVALNTAKVSNATHTGEVTGSGVLTIANAAVTNPKLANMPTKTYKGRTSLTAGEPEDIPISTVKVDLGIDEIETELEAKVDEEDLQLVSSQFGLSVDDKLTLLTTSIYLANTAVDVPFNVNYVIGSFEEPSTRDDLSLNLVSAKTNNTCVVFSKSTVEPTILSDEKIIFPADNYDTGSEKLNILTFKCLSPLHILCENLVITLPVVIPIVSGYYGFTRNASDITVSFAGCPVGDVMLVAMANLAGVGSTGFAYTKPSGWDSIIEMANGVDIWVRKRQIGDPDSYVFAVPNLISGGGTIAMSIRDSNYTNGNPSLVLQGATVGELNALNKTLPAVSLPKMSLCLAVFGIASNNATFTSFSAGWEEVAEDSRSGNRPLNIAMKTVDASSGTAVTTQSTGQNGAGLIIAFHS